MKQELLEALRKDLDVWLARLEQVDAKDRTSRSGNEWSLKDVIGHLAFCEQQTLDHIRETLKEGRPRPFPAGQTIDQVNGLEAARRKNWSWARVIAEYRNTRAALVGRVEGLSEFDLAFYVPSPWVDETRLITLEQLIREDVLVHSQEHRGEFL